MEEGDRKLISVILELVMSSSDSGSRGKHRRGDKREKIDRPGSATCLILVSVYDDGDGDGCCGITRFAGAGRAKFAPTDDDGGGGLQACAWQSL